MPTASQILQDINRLVAHLIETGLADDQCSAFQRTRGGDSVEVTFQGAGNVSIALRDRAYCEVYQRLVKSRAYNVKMLDGALIQMMYEFSNTMLHSHRLAFFPSPSLEEFQKNPEVYLEDEVYADVVAKNIVPCPVRFDYDARDGGQTELAHPKSHLTLGQYKNCRIPVTSPVTPGHFVDFILRSFYHTAFVQYADQLPTRLGSFGESILPHERSVVHVVIPT